MSIAKYDDRRLGFGADPWRTEADVRAFAQWVFLQLLQAEHPAVVRELASMTEAEAALASVEQSANTPAALRAWAARWHLTDDWCLAHAEATLRAFRWRPLAVRVWHDRDDVGGFLPGDHPVAAAPRPLKHGDHFRWLARYQSGASYHTIAAATGADVKTVHEACASAAAVIGLTLRPARRGRPRRA